MAQIADQTAKAARSGNGTVDTTRESIAGIRRQVDQIGAACHEGYQSCFFRSVEKDGQSFKITEPQLETPEQIYGKKK